MPIDFGEWGKDELVEQEELDLGLTEEQKLEAEPAPLRQQNKDDDE